MNCPELRRKVEASSLLRWTLQPWHTSHEIGSVSTCLDLSTSLDPLFLGIYFEQFKIWTYLNNMFEPFNYSGVLNALLHVYIHHSWYSCNITQYIYMYIYVYVCVICLYAYTFIYIYMLIYMYNLVWCSELTIAPQLKACCRMFASWPHRGLMNNQILPGWLANFRSHH